MNLNRWETTGSRIIKLAAGGACASVVLSFFYRIMSLNSDALTTSHILGSLIWMHLIGVVGYCLGKDEC